MFTQILTLKQQIYLICWILKTRYMWALKVRP